MMGTWAGRAILVRTVGSTPPGRTEAEAVQHLGAFISAETHIRERGRKRQM